MICLTGGKIITMEGDIWEKGYLCIEKGKILDLGPLENKAPFPLKQDETVRIIDTTGCIIMPGMIEAHCHMGIVEEKMGLEGDDCNESVCPITPYLRGIDGINPMDTSFEDARKAGITSAMIGPGSSNVVGGSFVFVKTYGNCIDEMVVKEPAAMKVSFGENPKVNYRELDKAPVTRMGIAAMLREELFKAKIYAEKRKQGKEEKRDFKYECWLPVLSGEIPLKAHVHRADDILTAIRIAKEFCVSITLDHCSEGHLIPGEIKNAGFPAIVGPDLISKNKIEVQNMDFRTAGILNKAGVKIAITTDHPVSLIQTLPVCAAMAVKAGLEKTEALKAITLYPAQICGVDKRVGSLKKGKDADIVVFDDDPLLLMSKVMCTIINGEIVYTDESFALPHSGKKV